MAQLDVSEWLARVLIANDGEVLTRLRLSAAEAARVCNVTPRQLIYWTKKGIVKASPEDDRDYDILAMEKVIRIRQALEKGYSLEKAAQFVDREMTEQRGELERLNGLSAEDLEAELRRRLERLEERVQQLRRTLPTSLTLARLRKAVGELDRLEHSGTFQESASNGDSAKALALRLSRAVDELEMVLREVQPTSA
jgi:DNA-binding transcriptional MerR regulator